MIDKMAEEKACGITTDELLMLALTNLVAEELRQKKGLPLQAIGEVPVEEVIASTLDDLGEAAQLWNDMRQRCPQKVSKIAGIFQLLLIATKRIAAGEKCEGVAITKITMRTGESGEEGLDE